MRSWGSQVGSHRGLRAVVYLPIVEEGHVLDEDGSGPQDEGREEMHVDVISGTVQLPTRGRYIWNAEGALDHPTLAGMVPCFRQGGGRRCDPSPQPPVHLVPNTQDMRQDCSEGHIVTTCCWG